MLKETGYQKKIEMLEPWLVFILEVIKKDLRQEHLKIDRLVCKRYFWEKILNVFQPEEMAIAYSQDIKEGNVGLGEFIATRWLLKNTDIYSFFEERLAKLSPDFENIDELDVELSRTLVEAAVKEFGALRTYIFSVFNSVVFPPLIYQELHALAVKESAEETIKIEESKAESVESLSRRHARELSSLSERFEKKFSGLQKKYLHDVESLKKQISALQKKLNEKI